MSPYIVTLRAARAGCDTRTLSRLIEAPATPLIRNQLLQSQPIATIKLQSFQLVELALAIRLFLTVCAAVLALGAAWAEKASKADRSRSEAYQPQIYYAPRVNLESVDAQEIGRAELSIDMAAYVLSDPRIIEALTVAAERGVLIRLYLDKSQFAEHGPTRGGLVGALLAHPNVVARVKGEGVLMHLKAYAVDGAVLRTGSGNFSRSGLAAQDNDAIFLTDPMIVDAFEGNFERIWARAQNIGALDATR
jgi:phosphatidylserine/phosphatidylglycerophosphate/cardiolipin synthase-like enzyme